MFKEERRTAILNLLIKDNSVSVSKLAILFNVSQETIRSDLCYFSENRYAPALLWWRYYQSPCLEQINY